MARAKKIIHIVSGLGLGGAETLLYRLLTVWSGSEEAEHVVISLRNNCSFDFSILNIKCYIFDLSSPLSAVRALWHLRKFLSVESPDLIHAWMYHGCLVAWLLSGSNVPVVWGIHHSLHDLSNEKLSIKLIIKGCSYISHLLQIRRIIYVSEASRAHHVKYGYAKDKSVVIPNGFDCTTFNVNIEAGSRIRASLGIDDDRWVLGSFGRYHPVKNHRLLFESFALALVSFPRLILLLAGTGLESNNKILMDLLMEYGIKDRVFLLGPRSDMADLYNALNVYVLSSKSESFPNVLGEALACGVPCITTNVGDAEKILGGHGIIIEHHNADSLSKAFLDYLGLDVNSRKAMGMHGREHIVNSFSIESVSKKYLNLYCGEIL